MDPAVTLGQTGAAKAGDTEACAANAWLTPRVCWLVLLATIAHALPALWEAGRVAIDLVEGRAWEVRSVGTLARDVITPALVGVLWPIGLGVLLVWLRWPELLWPAIATLFFVVVSDACRVYFTLQGKVDFEPWPGVSPRMVRGIDLAAHLVSLGLTTLVLFHALRVKRGTRRRRREGRVSSSRPAAILGRMGLVGALLFALHVVLSQAWVVYEKYGLQEGSFRAMMARPQSAQPRRGGRGGPLSAIDKRALVAMADLDRAVALSAQQHFAESSRVYSRALSVLEQLADESKDSGFAADARAQGFNNLAWMLCTCPDESMRDALNAVKFARRSLEIDNEDGNTWNTLGVALYRADDLSNARDAFTRSMDKRHGGDAFDWFFVAMLEQRQHQAGAASEWLEKAIQYRIERMPRNEELYRFHVEAAKLFELEPPPVVDVEPAAKPRPGRFRSPVGPSSPGP